MNRALVMLLWCCLLGCAETPTPVFRGDIDDYSLATCYLRYRDYVTHRHDYWTISEGDHGWKLYSIFHEEPVARFYYDGSCVPGRFYRRDTPSLSDASEPRQLWVALQ